MPPLFHLSPTTYSQIRMSWWIDAKRWLSLRPTNLFPCLYARKYQCIVRVLRAAAQSITDCAVCHCILFGSKITISDWVRTMMTARTLIATFLNWGPNYLLSLSKAPRARLEARTSRDANDGCEWALVGAGQNILAARYMRTKKEIHLENSLARGPSPFGCFHIVIVRPSVSQFVSSRLWMREIMTRQFCHHIRVVKCLRGASFYFPLPFQQCLELFVDHDVNEMMMMTGFIG